MCGICGIFAFNSNIKPYQLVSMTELMRHRGPDDEGYILFNTQNDIFEHFHSRDTVEEIKIKTKNISNVTSENYTLGFGFRRLAIIDLSAKGHQPMSYEERGLHIVFNGQIYNYLEIRKELESYGYRFFSNSDTEVILKSYDKWGEQCVNRFNGMWAFVIWDSKNKKLFCSRDRFGVKPFYYYYNPGNMFVFSSEIKPLLLFVNPEENLEVIKNNFALGISDYNEETFFKNIYQLRGSHNLTVLNGSLNLYRYYSLPVKTYDGTFEQAKELLKELIFDSVKIRLRSDVEVGYALSGGLDSASIVCVASELKAENNHTFSMILPESNYDESRFIDYVITKTRFKKHTVNPSFEDFIKDLDNFVYYHEEPFGGLSFYGENKVRELTHNNGIKVCLDGQGADEIFAGYPSVLMYYYKDLISDLKFSTFLKEYKRLNNNRNPKFHEVFKNILFCKQRINTNFLKKKYPYLNFKLLLTENNLSFSEFKNYPKFNSSLNNELYSLIFHTSLPRLLTGGDKVAMSFSVESRNPFLDYRIVEFGLSLPYNYKICNGYMKYILRESMKSLIPPEIYNRKDKIGFILPENRFTNETLLNQIKEIIFGIKDNDVININLFKKHFFDNSINKKDWKFWKTFSYLMWYKRFIL